MRAASAPLMWASAFGVAVAFTASMAVPDNLRHQRYGQRQTLVPDTTADSIWAFLESANYQRHWDIWPGQHALDPGREPHGMIQSTYMNAVVKSALDSGIITLPPGAIVVKENHDPDSVLMGVLVMLKITGYDPDNGDWLYAAFAPRGRIDKTSEGDPAIGRVSECIECHGRRADRDYLYSRRPD